MNLSERQKRGLDEAQRIANTTAQLISSLIEQGSDAGIKQAELLQASTREQIDRLEPAIKAMVVFPNFSSERWLNRIVTQDVRMLDLKQDVRKMVDTTYPVLIQGESGTGKELIAQALHGSRKGAFVAVNCAALPPELIASELFGHKRGSFTGAVEDRAGKFQAANNGTLFLDEIGDMNLDMQSKLLRVLQERRVVRLGDNTEYEVNCRVVCATHRNLQDMVAAKEFRLDLWKRLSILELRTVPLRERMADVPLILQSLNKQFPVEKYMTTPSIIPSEGCLHGNVRDLQAIVIRWEVLGKLPL